MRATLVAVAHGRRLEVEVLGPQSGPPVLYFHGAAGSPLRRCPDTERAVRAAGIKLLMVSRPGFGASDRAPGRTLVDWPFDVAALADALGLDRFAVLGVSAGGPYAAACVWALPDRVSAAAVVSGTVPLWGAGSAATRVRSGRDPRRHVAWGRPSRTTCTAFLQGMRTVRSHGVGGMLADARISLGPWGFAPEAVTGEVHLWHGAQDATVPLHHALAMAARYPRCHTTVLLEEGHFFLRRRMGEILGALASADRARAARQPAA
jgi:pimeloyl-ACP methyl ester carboxylesterase